MNAAVPAPDRSTCLLCAVAGMLAAALMLVVLGKMLFLAPAGLAMLPLDVTCSLSREACTTPLPDGGALVFSIGSRPVPILKPLTLEIRIEGSTMRPVAVDFSGISQPMAFNRAYPSATGEGSYSAQATLPICAGGRMTWQATVRLENGERGLLAPFRFETAKNS